MKKTGHIDGFNGSCFVPHAAFGNCNHAKVKEVPIDRLAVVRENRFSFTKTTLRNNVWY